MGGGAHETGAYMPDDRSIMVAEPLRYDVAIGRLMAQACIGWIFSRLRLLVRRYVVPIVTIDYGLILGGRTHK
jgi:hypothetical protein